MCRGLGATWAVLRRVEWGFSTVQIGLTNGNDWHALELKLQDTEISHLAGGELIVENGWCKVNGCCKARADAKARAIAILDG